MSSVVTFIIGNGLDLNLGLKTSYSHFYEHVQHTKARSKNQIYTSIEEDPETWANFEYKLGTLTNTLEEFEGETLHKKISRFYDDLEQVQHDLAEYLTSEQSKIKESDVKVDLTKTGFYLELPMGQRPKVAELISQNGYTTFNFVTLNYTSTLNNILPPNNTLQLRFKTSVGAIHHLHGTLKENMTMGVGDDTQISGILSGDDRDELIKPRSIETSNDDRLITMDRLLNQGNVVVLFGTSIGETDNYLWKHLVDWLRLSKSRCIVIHAHDRSFSEDSQRIPRRRKLFISSVQNQLLDFSDIDESLKIELRKRIFVIHNTKNLFIPN